MRRSIRRRNPLLLKTRTPALDIVMRPKRGTAKQIRPLLKAHGFKRTKRGSYKLHMPPMSVSVRTSHRNPSVYAQDLRPGDTIMLDGIGREHVIEGPFRSARGIRFVDQHGNGIMLKPGEVVQRVASGNPSKRPRSKRRANPRHNPSRYVVQVNTVRGWVPVHQTDSSRLASERASTLEGKGSSVRVIDTIMGDEVPWVRLLREIAAEPNPAKGRRSKRRANPPVREVTRIATLQQRVAALLNGAGMIQRNTRFRETSMGGLQANGVDAYELSRNPWMLAQLRRIAHQAGFNFELHGGSFLMLPERGVVMAAYSNPSRAIARRKAPKRVVQAYRKCVRKAKGGKRNPWAGCRRKVQKKTGRKYKALRNPSRRGYFGGGPRACAKCGLGLTPAQTTATCPRCLDTKEHGPYTGPRSGISPERAALMMEGWSKRTRRNPIRGLRYEVWVDRGGKFVPVHASDDLSHVNDRAHMLIQRGQYAYVQDASTGRIVGPYIHSMMQYRAQGRARKTMPAIVLHNPSRRRSHTNPSKVWREGTHVVFDPNPVSLAMYGSGYSRLPARGEHGVVTTVAMPSKRVTRIGGPGGGLVYVRWDHVGTMGISPYDLKKTAARRSNPTKRETKFQIGTAVEVMYRGKWTPGVVLGHHPNGYDVRLIDGSKWLVYRKHVRLPEHLSNPSSEYRVMSRRSR